jgi:hypothetical protein
MSSTATFDAVEQVLIPAVSQTMGALLNCPVNIAMSLRGWSESFNRSMSGDAVITDFEQAETSLTELTNLIGSYENGVVDGTWIEQLFRSCRPTFDWTERRQTLLLLMLAGFDTSISMLSNCLLTVLKNGNRAGRELRLSSTNESLVQATCPVKFTMREVIAPFEFEGCSFAAGDRVLLSWYGGNKHLAGDGQLLDRAGFAFGVNSHTCLGRAVAMRQLDACFRGIERVGRELVLRSPVIYNDNLCFHYPHILSVAWSSRPD